MYIPFTRAFGTESTFTLLALDLPFNQGGIRGKPFFPSKVGRDDGVVLWGNFLRGLFQYRLGLSDGQDGEANPDRNPRFAGRISLSLLEPETEWFNEGNYLGKKRVLSMGAGLDSQDSLKWTQSAAPRDYLASTADVFLDYPIGSGSVTFESAYVDMQNAVDGRDATTWYASGGFLIPRFLALAQLQPYCRYETLHTREGKDTHFISGGLNVFVKGHSLKAVADYTLVKPAGNSKEKQQSLITLQIQAGL